MKSWQSWSECRSSHCVSGGLGGGGIALASLQLPHFTIRFHLCSKSKQRSGRQEEEEDEESGPAQWGREIFLFKFNARRTVRGTKQSFENGIARCRLAWQHLTKSTFYTARVLKQNNCTAHPEVNFLDVNSASFFKIGKFRLNRQFS